MNNCIFCQKKEKEGKLHFPSLLRIALRVKYNNVDPYSIDDLIKKAHKRWVVEFYEQTYNTEEEYLERYYSGDDLKELLCQRLEYYKYRLDTPQMFMLPLCKVMLRYNRNRKDLHYYYIKLRLGMIPQRVEQQPETQNIQILPDLQEPSLSIISLLNKMKSSPIQQKLPTSPSIRNKVYTQQSFQTKLVNTKKLKTILTQDTSYKPQLKIQNRKILSNNSLSNKIVSVYKSPNRQLKKVGSTPDITSGIYLSKQSYQNKLTKFQKQVVSLVYRNK